MTSKQESFYWRLWGAAARAQGWKSGDNDRRHAVTVEALGTNVSHKAFTNAQFDKIISILKRYGDQVDLAATEQEVDPSVGHRRRLVYGIAKRVADAYAQKIAADRWGISVTDWRMLPIDQLEQLHTTVIERARTKSSHQEAEEPAATGPECPF